MRLERFEHYPRVVAAFTGRAEGNLAAHTGGDPDHVATQRALVASRLGMTFSRLGFMHQVHSAVVAPVGAPEDPAPVADALLDASGRRAPVVLTADCVPVLFAAGSTSPSQTEPLLAAAHAGRNGLLDGVLLATVRELAAAGGTDVEAWIGPSICGECYEVPLELQSAAEARMPGISSTTSWGTPALDLVGAAERELSAAGVLVHRTGVCTLHGEGYFSYRAGDATPRNASLVYATPDSPAAPPPLEADPGTSPGAKR